MKKITKGNDFIMRIPVVRIYNGERIAMPLPGCTDIVVNLCSQYRRLSLSYTIDVAEDNVILARVEGDQLFLGTYALEVKGKIGGVDWRSNEYEQITIVNNNAQADTVFDTTEEGENSLLMDTAVAILAPDTGLYDKVLTAEEAREVAETKRAEAEAKRIGNEDTRINNEVTRIRSEHDRYQEENKRQEAENERTAAENRRDDAEFARIENEKQRVANEKSRENEETNRQMAELERVNNETARSNAETDRINAELARVAAEKSRSEAEALRQQAENGRDAEETKRQTAEDDRIAEETKRQNAENERISNETTRQAKESERMASETTRQVNETTRQNAEATRQTKETERQTAETDRIKNNEACVNATNQALTAANEATEAAKSTVELATRAEATISASEKAANDAATAVTTANQALTAANEATEAANTATSNATTAAQSANDAAGRANEAADLVYNGPDEVVAVACYTSVDDVSTAGLVLNVYINDNPTPQQYTTDDNGLASFRVTKGLKYDIAFPDIEGCSPIGKLTYTAALQTRGIEVTYNAYSVENNEKVTISFRKYPENTTWNGGEVYADGVAYATIDGVRTTYNADSNGQVQFLVPIGTEYTVEIQKPSDLHLINGVYSATYTADRAARVIPVAFHIYLSDILIVDTDGGEWTYDGFINSGKDPSEGVLLHIATEELLAAGCDFFLSVNMMAYRKFDTDGTEIRTMNWASQSVQFTSIPLNGDSAAKDYFYDGLTATNLIVQEGLSRGLETQCHTRTMRETFSLGVTTLQGYTPARGQYEILIANYTYINDIVTYLRPDGDVVTKYWGINKGTSTQQSATYAYYVSSYVSSYGKDYGNLYAPCCAYAKPTL